MMPENKPMKMQWLNIDGRQVPSILPNHWNDQKNDWDITGTKNPLPIANYTQNASGVWLPTSKDNPVPTQLTGSYVDKITVVDALALTDIKNVISDNVDLTNYKKFMFYVINTHDAKIGLRAQYNSSYIRYFDFEEGEVVSTGEKGIIIPNFGESSQCYFLNQDSVLTSLPLRGNVRFLINAVTTPTQGSLTIGLIGEVL